MTSRRGRYRVLAATLALTLLATPAWLGWAAPGRAGEGSGDLVENGRVTFADLGQTGPVTLTAGSPSLALEVALPKGASQGDPVWYGVYLHYSWNGVPGVDEQGYLYAAWNGRALYQLKVKTDPRWPAAGMTWSMVDLVSGASRSQEVTRSFSAASTNFAVLSAVHPGQNAVSVTLDLSFTQNQGMSATVYPDSAVVATRWKPARVEWSGSASVSDDLIQLRVQGQNKGWQAPSLSVASIAYYPDGSIAQQVSELRPGLGPGEAFEAEVEHPLRERPLAVDAILSWGTGNSPKRVFPEAGSGLPLPFAVGGGGYWVAVALFAIAWVSFSTAFAARLPEGDSPAPRRVRIRLPASRGRRLAIVAVALVGTVGAVVLVAPTPWEGAAGPGPYPFANFPEFPVLQPSDLAGAEAILLAAVPELRGQAWQMLGATPATRGGAKFGVFAQVVGKDGGALTVLPEHLRGTCGAGEPGSSQGLTVMVDLDAGALVLLSPLGADPGCTNLR